MQMRVEHAHYQKVQLLGSGRCSGSTHQVKQSFAPSYLLATKRSVALQMLRRIELHQVFLNEYRWHAVKALKHT